MRNQDMGLVLKRQIEKFQWEKAAIASRLRLKHEWAGDTCDKADILIEQAEAWARYRFLDQRCQRYKHAKARCDEGLAGVCEVCGDAIDPERLQVMIDATACVPCRQRTLQRHAGSTQRGLQHSH